MKQPRTLNPDNCSEETKRLNPHLFGPPRTVDVPPKSIRRGRMNKTEASFARLLESIKGKGIIKDFRFEGLRLAYGTDPETGKQIHYTPDFVAINPDGSMRLLEIKGGHIFPNAILRFKCCRAFWPEFTFEMWQYKKGEWKKIH